MNLDEYVENKVLENELVEKIAKKIVFQMQVPEFGSGGVPTSVAARVMGKSEAYIISGLEQGWLPLVRVLKIVLNEIHIFRQNFSGNTRVMCGKARSDEADQ